jgi:hypothetical protein
MPNPSMIEVARILAARIGFRIEEYRDTEGALRYRCVPDASLLPNCCAPKPPGLDK